MDLTDITGLLDLLAGLASTPSEAGGFTELDHGLQCAAVLAQRRPADLELQIAGLVHDIGHEFGPDDLHGRIGADMVRPLLGQRVAALVEGHVTAKRYLVTTEPDYAGVLSDTSTTTLAIQGGTLNPEEVADFEASPHFADAVELRRADDSAKVPGRAVAPLDHWVPVLKSLCR